MDERVAEYELARMDPAMAGQIERVPGGLEARSLHLMFSDRKSDSEALRDRFNQGLQALKESGEREALRRIH
ncbi:MAG: hypothetical protein R3296_05220 [Oleiphilaceae bacterium]|nr:hypothetical protein [Oleiphilaceae bacterium]